MCRVAETLKQVDPGSALSWEKRVMLGCWTVILIFILLYHPLTFHKAKCVSLCIEYLPGFSVANIGFCTHYSWQFLTIPSVGYVMLQPSLVSPNGRGFIAAVQWQDRQIYSWTVNDRKEHGLVHQKGFDGVVTEDVSAFLQMCEESERRTYRWPISLVLGFAYFNIIYRRRYGTSLLERTETDKDK